jgi:AcrR family transcriptional regulator
MAKASRALHDRDLLLDTAASVFRRKGFAAATLRHIASAAGIRPGSLHYRYKAKEDLLTDLMERAMERLTAAVQSAVAQTSDPAERLRLGLRAHLETLLSGDDSIYVLLYDFRSLERGRAAMTELRRRYEAVWDRLLQAAIDKGLARPGVDVALLRQFGFGAMNWVAQWHAEEGARSAEEIADAFWSYLALGLLRENRRSAFAKKIKSRLGHPAKRSLKLPGRPAKRGKP